MVVFYAFIPEQKKLQKDLHKPTPMDFPGIKHWAESIRLHNSTGPNIHSLIWFPQTLIPLSNSHTLLRICLPFSIWPSMTADYRSSLRTHSIYYTVLLLFSKLRAPIPWSPSREPLPHIPGRQGNGNTHTYPKEKKKKEKREQQLLLTHYVPANCNSEQSLRVMKSATVRLNPRRSSPHRLQIQLLSRHPLHIVCIISSSSSSPLPSPPTPCQLLVRPPNTPPPPSLFLCHNITTTRRSPKCARTWEPNTPIWV